MDFPSESLFIIIFLLISFLSWVSENVKKARMKGRQRRPQQSQYEGEPTAQAPSREPTSSQEGSATMREILESLGIPTQVPQPVDEPPPLPEVRYEPREAIEPVVESVEETLSAEEKAALARLQAKDQRDGNYAIAEHVAGHPTQRARQLLRHPNVQAAFVLKEILDRPKCFD